MPGHRNDGGLGNRRKTKPPKTISTKCRAFEQLLADIAKAFNSAEQGHFAEVMNDSLGRIGRFLKCDRSAVLLFDSARNRIRATYGWADEGTPPVQLGRYIESDLPWYAGHLRSGHLLWLDVAVDLPPEAARERRLLLDEGVQSHLSIPLINDGISIGAVTFVSFRSIQCWAPELIVRFRLAAEILTLALNKCEYDRSHALSKAQRSKHKPIILRTDSKKLQRLALSLMEAEDRERKRLAEILHEDIMQTLAVAGFMTDCSQPSQLDFNKRVLEANRLIRSSIRDLRVLVLELQPVMLCGNDVGAAMRRLGEHVSLIYSMRVEIDPGSGETPAAEPLNRLLFDATRHLLSNAAVHGHASEATVELRRIGPSRFRLTVTDNGLGFDTRLLEQIPCKSFGLFALREKAQLLGGSLDVTSSPGRGTRVAMILPKNPG